MDGYSLPNSHYEPMPNHAMLPMLDNNNYLHNGNLKNRIYPLISITSFISFASLNEQKFELKKSKNPHTNRLQAVFLT